MNFLQNLSTLRVSSVPKTYQLYAHLQFPKPANFTCTSRLQHLSILHVPSVSNTYQFYMYLPSPTPINFTCTFRLQHLSILRISSVSNIQNPCPGFHSSDNRWQRKSELSINSGYIHEGRRTLAKACVNAGSHLC